MGISKRTWVDAYMKLTDDDPVIQCFSDLGRGPLPDTLWHGELPSMLKPLEEFVCNVYSASGPRSIPALRWELFRSKNLEGEMLPPTRSALLPHIRRANYITMRDKSYDVNHPALPPIEDNGWTNEESGYAPVLCLALPAPLAVIELTKCGCRTHCVSKQCSCSKNGLPCTPLCKCYGDECQNPIRPKAAPEDDE